MAYQWQRRRNILGSTLSRFLFRPPARGLLSALSLFFVLLLGSVASGAVQPAFVQEKDTQITFGSTNRTTFAAPNTAGNLIVVYVVWDNTSGVSVSDSLGNTYTSAIGPTRWNNNRNSVQTFYAINRASGSNTVTASFSRRIQSFAIAYAHEYSGVRSTGTIDVAAALSGNSGSLNSGSITTTNDLDLIFAGGVSASTVTSASPGYSTRSVTQGNLTEDRVVSTRGAYGVTANNAGGAWAMQVVAFKGSAASPTDSTIPTTPAGLSAVAISSSQISLSWNASSDAGNAPSELYYGIYRNGSRIGTTAAGATSWTDSSLVPSTTYSYTVSAYDPAGNNSAQSSSASATTLGSSDTVSPTVPGNLHATGASSSTISLAWNASTDNIAVAGYKVFRNGALVGTSPGTSYSDSGLTASTTYTYSVSAYDGAGNNSAPTTSINVSTGTTSQRPYVTNFSATENPISEGGNWINGRAVGVDWGDVATASGLAFGTNAGSYADPTAILAGSWGPDQMAQATVYSVNQTDSLFEEVELRLRSAISAHSNTGYEINFRCSKTNNAYSQIVRWNGPLGNFTYLWAQDGSQYGVKTGDVVKATIIGNVITVYINGTKIASVTDNTYKTGNPGMGFYLNQGSGRSKDYGFTSFTAADSLTADTVAPSIPQSLVANAVSSSQIDLTWAASSDNVAVTGYKVFRNSTQIGTTSTVSYSDRTASPEVQYTYAVAAVDAAGNSSGLSSAVVAGTSGAGDTTPPSIPSNLRLFTATSTSVTISWSASNDDTGVAGYRIFRDGAQVGTTSATTYTDAGLAASTGYTYTVAAFDSANNVSAQSSQLIASTVTTPSAAPSIVQLSRNQVTNGSSVSATLDAPTVAGNTIVVYAIWSNTNSVALTDSRGNPYVNVGAPVAWGSGYSAQVFYASNVAGGADVITASFRTSVNSFGVLYVHEYAGISKTNPVDVTSSAVGTSASLNSGPITTTSPNDLIFGAGVSDDSVTGGGSGFSVRDLSYGNITEDRVAASTGSYAATATHSGNRWAMQAVAFRAAQ